MNNRGLWLILAVVGAAIFYNRQQIGSAAESGVEDVQSALTGWKGVHEGPTWVPVLNAAETRYGIPQDLLARMAYQESRFRPDVIDGSVVSRAGALGILQMLPQYFSTVQAARPFTTADTTAQIDQAAQQLAGLYSHFQDWTLAVAGYNDGQGNIDAYVAGRRDLPTETADYVAQVTADVPVPGALAA